MFVEDESGGDGGGGGAHARAERQFAVAAEAAGHGQTATRAETGQRQVAQQGGEAVDDEIVRAAQDVLHGALAPVVLLEAAVKFVFETMQCSSAVVFADGGPGEGSADGAATVDGGETDGGVARDGADDGGRAIDDGVFAAEDNFAGGTGAGEGVVVVVHGRWVMSRGVVVCAAV